MTVQQLTGPLPSFICAGPKKADERQFPTGNDLKRLVPRDVRERMTVKLVEASRG